MACICLYGNKFILNTDHNPLVYLRNKKDPRGKFARWLSELEEFDYQVQYIPGSRNVKADALSRNNNSHLKNRPEDRWEDHIYFVESDRFHVQLQTEQDNDPVISNAKTLIRENKEIPNGRLRRVRRQLRIENGILTKSGRPIIPHSLQSYVTDEIHKHGLLPNHFGIDKTYSLLKRRFYWPNMFGILKNYVAGCKICGQCKVDSVTPRAPLIPIITPQCPMEFIAIDIAHMETDTWGYRYLLIIARCENICNLIG